MTDSGAADGQPAYQLKAHPEAFQVYERLDWSAVVRLPVAVAPQQLWLVEKRNLNSLDLVRALAQGFDIPQVEIGYAGRKDRRALTRQWVSLPNRCPVADVFALLGRMSGPEGARARGLTVLGCQRKLRIGTLLGNRFRLRVELRRPLSRAALDSALARLKAVGFPNFFGSQRVNARAVAAATQQLLQARASGARRRPRQQRGGAYGWALSVVRSKFFNEVLAAHLAADIELLGARTGPLWGRGRPEGDAQSVAFEARVLAGSEALLDCLEHAGLRQERRALAVVPTELEARLDDATLALRFALPPGSYATELVAHLFRLCGRGGVHDQSIDTMADRGENADA